MCVSILEFLIDIYFYINELYKFHTMGSKELLKCIKSMERLFVFLKKHFYN